MTERQVAVAEEAPSDDAGPMQIRVSHGACEGRGECNRWAPEVFPLDEDGCVDIHLMEVPSGLAERATWGAGVCPERAITVIGPPLDFWIERRRASKPRLARAPAGDRTAQSNA